MANHVKGVDQEANSRIPLLLFTTRINNKTWLQARWFHLRVGLAQIRREAALMDDVGGRVR